MDRGTYASRTSLKAHMGIATTDTADDATLLSKLEAASRFIDGPYGCNRHFYVKTATRTFTSQFTNKLLLDYDLLSITSLKHDSDTDWDYDYTWAATDYHLYPFNEYPKTKIMTKSGGDYSFPSQEEGVQIAGLWGYGTGDTATPYTDSGTNTAEELDASETGVDVGDGTALAVGQTILVESEQMYITAISTNTLTVVRGVNGTTAATHATSKDVYIYQYPPQITEACVLLAVKLFRLKDAPYGVIGSGGDMGVVMAGRLLDPRIVELLASYRREVVV